MNKMQVYSGLFNNQLLNNIKFDKIMQVKKL